MVNESAMDVTKRLDFILRSFMRLKRADAETICRARKELIKLRPVKQIAWTLIQQALRKGMFLLVNKYNM